MRVRLLDPGRETPRSSEPPAGDPALIEDLGLDRLIETMADGDAFLELVARTELTRPVTDLDTLRYRVEVPADALAHPAVVRALHRLANEANESQLRLWRYGGRRVQSVLSKAVHGLTDVMPSLRSLRERAAEFRPVVESAGFSALLDSVLADLDEAFFTEVEDHLARLQHHPDLAFTASLDVDGALTAVVPHRTEKRRRWRDLLGLPPADQLTFTIAERDDAGARALGEMRDRALLGVAEALGQCAEHVRAFYDALQWDTAFLLGCLNLHAALRDRGVDTCLPRPHERGGTVLHAARLRDPGLALLLGNAPVASDLDADGSSIVIISGASQGGKTTFLRALGTAQLLMQCGLVVPASVFEASIVPRVHTHFRRGEDTTMEHGKLDEELARMSALVDAASPGDLVLSNDSFTSTNEREGGDIAREVFQGLLVGGVRVVAVTHLEPLVEGFLGEDSALFLAPQRTPEGQRTFVIQPERPNPTSHALDIFDAVFGS